MSDRREYWRTVWDSERTSFDFINCWQVIPTLAVFAGTAAVQWWTLNMTGLRIVVFSCFYAVAAYLVISVINVVRIGSGAAADVWREDQNRIAALKREVENNRPDFSNSQISIDLVADHQNSDRVKLFVFVTLCNRGGPSAVDRWQLKILSPTGQVRIVTDSGALDRSTTGPEGLRGGNLLHDTTRLNRNDIRKGWLMYYGSKDEIGDPNQSQVPRVELSFADATGRLYAVKYPEGFAFG